MSYAGPNQIIDALHEGIVSGIIASARHHNPDATDEDIKFEVRSVLHDWPDDELDYWFDWLGVK